MAAAPPTYFVCALEKDHNPPISKEADHYYQIARQLQKSKGFKEWDNIVANYQKAIDLGNWKAMNNLAELYREGGYSEWDYDNMEKQDNYDLPPTGVKRDNVKMLILFNKMTSMGVPMGYYQWARAIARGDVKEEKEGDAGLFMRRGAELGNPNAQVVIGNYYAFGLPHEQQRDDVAEQYFRCAGKQNNAKALEEVASFYEIAKKNKPLALYYYQKEAANGGTKGLLSLIQTFEEGDINKMGYKPNPKLVTLYQDLYNQLRNNKELKFPNLMKDHPLPRHPTQGYDADHPDTRPIE